MIEFADVDKDGLISLYEFYLFVDFMQSKTSITSEKAHDFLATSEDLVQFFGADPKKQITKEEYRKCKRDLSLKIELTIL